MARRLAAVFLVMTMLAAAGAVRAQTPEAPASPTSPSAAPPNAPPGRPAAQPAPMSVEERRARKEAAEAKWQERYEAKDYAGAEASLRELIALAPGDFLPWYNLACVQCLQEQFDNASKSLLRAVDLGFTDFATMERDENLKALHDTRVFRALLAKAGEIQNATIDKRIERYQQGFAKKYAVERDEARKLAFLSGLDKQAFRAAREEMDRLAAWWDSAISPDAPEPARPHPWVLVVLPVRKDYNAWAAKNFGDRAEIVGGIYDHGKLELVAKDLGPTLRHEFFHCLHWRDMTARRVLHPMWVQEGLCSVVEDLVWQSDGTAKPLPSWRTNQLKRLMASANLPPWKEFFAMPANKFNSGKSLLNYAMGRSIALFAYDQGKLKAWYAALNATCREDPTGAKSLEVAFGEPLAAVEKRWRAWLKELPMVGDQNAPTLAQLPFGISDGTGDGILVASISYRTESETKLKWRDVITAINDQTTHDLNDVARILTSCKPGDEVTVAYRRGKTSGTSKVKLIQRE